MDKKKHLLVYPALLLKGLPGIKGEGSRGKRREECLLMKTDSPLLVCCYFICAWLPGENLNIVYARPAR